MSKDSVSKCKHCGTRIVKERSVFGQGDTWMHQPEGAAFKDGQYEYCKKTVATPEEIPKTVTSAEEVIYKWLHQNPGKNYVDKDDGSLYALTEGGMLCFTGDFREMSETDINGFLEKSVRLQKRH